jgi:hypothetical protein
MDVYNLRALFFLVNQNHRIPSNAFTRNSGQSRLRFAATKSGTELIEQLNEWKGWSRRSLTPDTFCFNLAQLELRHRTDLPILPHEAVLEPELQQITAFFRQKWDAVEKAGEYPYLATGLSVPLPIPPAGQGHQQGQQQGHQQGHQQGQQQGHQQGHQQGQQQGQQQQQ